MHFNGRSSGFRFFGMANEFDPHRRHDLKFSADSAGMNLAARLGEREGAGGAFDSGGRRHEVDPGQGAETAVRTGPAQFSDDGLGGRRERQDRQIVVVHDGCRGCCPEG